MNKQCPACSDGKIIYDVVYLETRIIEVNGCNKCSYCKCKEVKITSAAKNERT